MPDHSALRDGDAEFRDGVAVVRGGDPREAPRVTRLAACGVLVRDGRIRLCGEADHP
jgi:hypothetical protein